MANLERQYKEVQEARQAWVDALNQPNRRTLEDEYLRLSGHFRRALMKAWENGTVSEGGSKPEVTGEVLDFLDAIEALYEDEDREVNGGDMVEIMGRVAKRDYVSATIDLEIMAKESR